MANRSNKKKFIETLIKQLKTIKIATKQAKNYAHVLIIEIAIEESKHQETSPIVGEDLIAYVTMYKLYATINNTGEGIKNF